MILPPQITSRDFGRHGAQLQRPLRALAMPLEFEVRHCRQDNTPMCNLYSITTNQEAIQRLFRVMNIRRQLAADAGRLP